MTTKRPPSPEFALLGLLALGPGHGYGLHQALTTELGMVWHVSQSQAYAILNRLVARGDVAARTVPQAKRPDRQMLRLSKAGRERFQAWLHEPPGSTLRALRLDLLTRLYFLHRLEPAAVPALLDDQHAVLQAAVRRLEDLLTRTPAEQESNRLSLELRIHQLRSALVWLEACRRSQA